MRHQHLFRVHRNVMPGLVIGVVGIACWILLCRLDLERYLIAHLPDFLRPGDRPAFNPLDSIPHRVARWGFIAVRMAGLAVLVPLVEELFWRGFLIRWFIAPEWHSVPLGRFTPGSFAGVTALFTLAHREWLAALVYCVLLNGLLIWKRDLWNCIVAHAVSNLILGVYILGTASWELW